MLLVAGSLRLSSQLSRGFRPRFLHRQGDFLFGDGMERYSMRLAVSLILGLLFSTAAVAVGDPDRPRTVPSQPLTLTRNQAALDRHAIEVFLRSRFKEARTAFDEGRYQQSYKICEAILVLAPDVSFQRSLLELRRRAHGRYLSRSAIAIRFDQELIPEGQPPLTTPVAELRGTVFVENLSRDRVVIGDRDETDPVMGMVQYQVRSVFENGHEATESGTQVLRMLEGISLDPGESRGISMVLALPILDRVPVLQEWKVSGSTRPLKVELADQVLTRSIPWIESQGEIYADGFAQIAEQPLVHLRRALLEANPARLAAAGDCWLRVRAQVDGSNRKERDEQMVDDLLATLGRNGGKIDGGVIHLLEKITGEYRERSVNSWRIWEITRPKREGMENRDQR